MRELCMKKVPKTLNEDKKMARKEVCFVTSRNNASNHGVENPCISETKVGLSVEIQNGFL
jgi:hypothetical protein